MPVQRAGPSRDRGAGDARFLTVITPVGFEREFARRAGGLGISPFTMRAI